MTTDGAINEVTGPTWRRAVYEVSAPQLLELLGIVGELVAIDHDPITGYARLIVSDPSAEPKFVGAYIEPRTCRVMRTIHEDGRLISEHREWA